MKKIIFIAGIMMLMSCERRAEWELQPATEKFVVVEGSFTDEVSMHQIRLSRPVANLNETPQPLTGATVSISDGSTLWPLTESDSLKGTYFTNANVSGTPGNTYTLKIEYGDTLITASDNMVSCSAFTPLKYAKAGNNKLYHITWVANAYHPNNAALYKINLDWSSLPEYAGQDPEKCRAVLYYYTLTTIDVSDMFSPAIEKITFPKGTVITEKKYSLSSSYEEFIRCLLLETSWRGGLWDAIPDNLPSNLSGKNVGFFAASAVKSTTFVVE